MPDYGAQIILHKWPVGQNNFENNTVHLFIFGSFLPCGSGPTNLPCAVHDGIGCKVHTVLGVGCRPRPCVTDQPAPGSRVGPTPLPSPVFALYFLLLYLHCTFDLQRANQHGIERFSSSLDLSGHGQANSDEVPCVLGCMLLTLFHSSDL